jgi:hypothetical protein
MKNKRIAAKISPETLWDRLQNKAKELYGQEATRLFDIIQIDKIEKDLLKVQFDFENSYYKTEDTEQWGFDIGPTQIDELSYIACVAGGDWEYPIYFIIYLDQDNKTLRAYIPSEGNPYNKTTKKAFGNDEEADSEYISKWIKKKFPEIYDPENEYTSNDADIMFNFEEIKNNIKNRIQVTNDP